MDFSETNVASDLKLIDLMKICEYLTSRSFLDLGPMSFTYENLTCFSQKPLTHFQPNFECKLVSTSSCTYKNLNLIFSDTTEPF